MPRIISVTTPADNESGVLKKHKVFMVVEFEDGLRTLEATLTPANCYEVQPRQEKDMWAEGPSSSPTIA